ncbi:hypothetical protein FBUS_06237, partial [Fasciolopsis buskii]
QATHQTTSTLIPSARVGHTVHELPLICTHLKPSLLLLGGADPDGTLDEAFIFSPSDGVWTKLNWEAKLSSRPSLARYEHTSAVLPDGGVIVFGGATHSGPLDDVLELRVTENPLLANVSISPDAGSFSAFPGEARTQHGATCLTEHGQLLIFAGGALGNQPVSDNQVHVYNAKSKSWSHVSATGRAPCDRLGHVLLYQCPPNQTLTEIDSHSVVPRGHLFIHGGMAGERFFDDFYQMEFSEDDEKHLIGVWRKFVDKPSSDKTSACMAPSEEDCLYQTGRIPCARAGHGGVCLVGPESPTSSTTVFIFGGVTVSGALNDMYCFDTGTRQWTEIIFEGPVPKPRLDFACCLFTKVDGDGLQINLEKYCFFVHGGMDTDGQMFNDSWTVVLTEKNVE